MNAPYMVAQAGSLETILDHTRALESNRDPKCDATASRLEDFIYGTPLTDEARFLKNDLQAELVQILWQRASVGHKASTLVADDIRRAAAPLFLIHRQNENSWQVRSKKNSVIISERDRAHYASIAYVLRAQLAVEQEQLLGLRPTLPELGAEAVAELKHQVELFSLAALQKADLTARMDNAYEIGSDKMFEVWHGLAELPPSGTRQTSAKALDQPLLRRIIQQKISAYEAYNQISMPVFMRNLQVYFARYRWPQDEEESLTFRTEFTELMISISKAFIAGAESVAQDAGHQLIRASDVNDFGRVYLPYSVDQYEDVSFFPQLDPPQQVRIEAYDLDAFRDSGLHWQYLDAALSERDTPLSREPDPFAAELLAENVAQLAVLLLRETGEVARAKNADALRPEFIARAFKNLRERAALAASQPPRVERLVTAAPPPAEAVTADRTTFADITRTAGLDYRHRSSAWLSRLIRSYTLKSQDVGNLVIPPAFSGSGIAAEDIDGDGLPDILLLGGTGPALYRNLGGGRFENITRQAGLNWRRPEDGEPGEARQPIIADLDNDGDQDIVITYAGDAHRVYRNLGAAAFEDVTEHSGLGGTEGVAGPATVADFNNDGLLDLFIGYFGDYVNGVLPTLARRNTNGQANRLFMNQGGLAFVDRTAASGMNDTGWTQAVGHTDLDGDGWQDIIVGNDFGANVYWRNLGNGRFDDVTSTLGLGKPSYTMNIGLADLNNDLAPDIYISNIVTMNKDEKYVLPEAGTVMKFDLEKLANMRIVEANDLFLSSRDANGNLHYSLSQMIGRGRHSTGWAWDADFFDMDNDGDDDLYVLNGMNEYNLYGQENPYYTDAQGKARSVLLAPPTKDRNVLFENTGRRLHNATDGSGLGLVANSRSAAYLDHDRDGDLDIVLNNFHDQAVMFENRSPQGRAWLSLSLIGAPSKKVSRDAIGARIIARLPDGRRIWREVHGTIGYMSVHPKEQHLGTGNAARVDLEIRWPNGERQHFENVATKQRYRITQGDKLQPIEDMPQ